MHKSPGRYHFRKRSTRTVRSLMSSQVLNSLMRSRKNGTTDTTSLWKAGSPASLIRSKSPLHREYRVRASIRAWTDGSYRRENHAGSPHVFRAPQRQSRRAPAKNPASCLRDRRRQCSNVSESWFGCSHKYPCGLCGLDRLPFAPDRVIEHHHSSRPSTGLPHFFVQVYVFVERRRPMKRAVCIVAGLMLFAQASAAQAPTAGQKVGLATSMQRAYATLKGNLTEAAAKMPEANYTFKPASDPNLRTFGQWIGHQADNQFLNCATIKGVQHKCASANRHGHVGGLCRFTNPFQCRLARFTLCGDNDYFRSRSIFKGVIGDNFHPAARIDGRSRFRYGIKVERMIRSSGNHHILKNLPRPGEIDYLCAVRDHKSNR